MYSKEENKQMLHLLMSNLNSLKIKKIAFLKTISIFLLTDSFLINSNALK